MSAPRRELHPVLWWSRAIGGWLVLLVVAAFVATTVAVPRLAGGTAYTVTSGSMRPNLPPGTLIVTRPADPVTLGIGDVITYQAVSGRPAVVTHRIIGLGYAANGEITFRTRGDANDTADAEPVRAVQVRGALWYALPYVGHVNTWVNSRTRSVLVYAISAALLGYAGWMFVSIGPGPPPDAAKGRGGVMRLRTPVAAAGLIMLGLVGLAPARPAVAQADQLQVSLDGRHWSSRIDRPLFDADRRWVPGDTETVTVWARNTSTDIAGLTIRILDQDPGSRLDDDLQLSATANGQPMSGTTGYPVVPGDPVRVDITLLFPAAATNASQRRLVDVTLRLTLTQRVGSAPPIPPGSEPGLPDTGAPPLVGVLLVAGPAAAVSRCRPARGAPPNAPTQPRRTMRPTRTRDRVRAVLAVGTVLGLGAVGTLAAWTDSSTATTGTFSTGTIDLRLGSGATDPNPFSFTTFALSNMAPGSEKEATLQVNNSGSLPFTYNVVGSATNSGGGSDQLGSALTLQIYAGSSCSGTVLNSPAKFTFTGLTAARTLTAGTNETLCFKATLPAGADTALQGKSTVGTFVFTATTT